MKFMSLLSKILLANMKSVIFSYLTAINKIQICSYCKEIKPCFSQWTCVTNQTFVCAIPKLNSNLYSVYKRLDVYIPVHYHFLCVVFVKCTITQMILSTCSNNFISCLKVTFILSDTSMVKKSNYNSACQVASYILIFYKFSSNTLGSRITNV